MADFVFENAFALLVGVGGYNFEITVKDATDIHKILVDPLRAGYSPDNVALLTGESSTRKAFIEQLDLLVEKTSKVDDATVFIYYSGHGGQYISGSANDGDDIEYYLKTWGHQENDPENTMLNGKIFTDRIEKIKAKRLIILLDCCHAAGVKAKTKELIIKGKDNISDKMKLSGTKLIEQLKGGKGRVFISACGDSETSVILPNAENSLFTQVTLEALDGAASGEDQMVRVIDLMYHLLRQVPERVKPWEHLQNPVINEVTDLNPSYYVCRNGKLGDDNLDHNIIDKETIPNPPKRERNIDFIRPPENGEENKMDFIRKYKTVVKIKVENNYIQKIKTNDVEKQIIINKNEGPINM
jgi:hypothetical protein